MHRRQLLRLTAGGAALLAAPGDILAQAYPSRPVTFVVFVAAGTGPDVVMRVVAQPLSQRLGQPVVIVDKPGAGGNLALQSVARTAADGYTLLLIGAPHAVNVTSYEDQSVNLVHDIVPVATIYQVPFIMMVANGVPARSVPEFIAYAKTVPGKINMASGGTGNLSHLAGELFKVMSGVDMVHIPYTGMPAAYTALMGGDAQVLFDTSPTALPLIRENKVRALAVTNPGRDKAMPDLPPIADTLPGYAVTGWIGVGAPAGTPQEIIDRLNKEINAALAEPETVERLTALGSGPYISSPADFGKFINSEVEKWGKVVRFVGLKSR